MRRHFHRGKQYLCGFSKLIFALVYTAITMGPIVWVLSMSLKTTDEIRRAPYALPEHWRFDLYADVWLNSNYGQYFLNSFLVVGGSILTLVVITPMAAYCFSKLPFRGSETVFTIIFSGIMIPAQILIIPLYQTLSDMQLINTRFGLMLIYVAIQMPMSIYILRSYFSSVPNELREAARIDGCSELGAYWRVMLPVAKPAICTILIINFINLWNEFLFGSVLIQKNVRKTLPLGMIQFVGDVNEDLGRIAVAVIIAITPVILIYSAFSESFMKGMTAGAVKG